MPSGLHRLKLLSSFAAVSALRPMMMSTAAASVSPPIAKRVSHTVTFGKVDGENRGTNPMEPVELQDDLFWIRDDTRKNEEVRHGSHISLPRPPPHERSPRSTRHNQHTRPPPTAHHPPPTTHHPPPRCSSSCARRTTTRSTSPRTSTASVAISIMRCCHTC